jgi:hypothetical protein
MIYFARVDLGTFTTRPVATDRTRTYFPHSIFFIKIGCSNNPTLRVKALSNEYDKPMTLLATMPGGLLEEEMMHNRFAHARVPRTAHAAPPEWFFPTKDLAAFIDWLVAHPTVQLDGKSGSRKKRKISA